MIYFVKFCFSSVCNWTIKKEEMCSFKRFLLCVRESISRLSSPPCVRCWGWIWGAAELIWSRWCEKVIIVLLFTHSQLTMYHLPVCESRAGNMPPVLAMSLASRFSVTHYISFHMIQRCFANKLIRDSEHNLLSLENTTFYALFKYFNILLYKAFDM